MYVLMCDAKWSVICEVRNDIIYLTHITAGVVALMIEASSHTLTARMIAHIIVQTAQRPLTVSWDVNGAGLPFHPKVRKLFSFVLFVYLVG